MFISLTYLYISVLSNCMVIQARVQEFVRGGGNFFFAFQFFRGGGPAQNIADKMILSTKKVAKYR